MYVCMYLFIEREWGEGAEGERESPADFTVSSEPYTGINPMTEFMIQAEIKSRRPNRLGFPGTPTLQSLIKHIKLYYFISP